jgi:hypothetical protein
MRWNDTCIHRQSAYCSGSRVHRRLFLAFFCYFSPSRTSRKLHEPCKQRPNVSTHTSKNWVCCPGSSPVVRIGFCQRRYRCGALELDGARLALPPNHVTTPSPQPVLPNSPTGPHTHGLRRLPWRDLASILDWSTAVIAQPRTQTCTWVLRVCFLRSQHAWPECLAPCPRVRLVAFYKSSGLARSDLSMSKR